MYGSKIYRTDLHGEIEIRVDKNGKIAIETMSHSGLINIKP